jgi:hypothetical protein
MDYLSTTNQWTYYCRWCDERYNDRYERMSEVMKAMRDLYDACRKGGQAVS